MNPALQFRSQLGRVSGWLRDELDQLVANISTGWAVEHDGDGHHTGIAANSMSANRVRFNGTHTYALNYVEASSKTLLGSGLYRVMFNRIQVPDNVSLILLKPDDNANVDPAVAGGGYEVGSLALSTQPKTGDVIFIAQSPQSAFPIHLRSLFASGDANFRFYIPPLMQNVDYGGAFTLAGNPGPVPFMYLEAPNAFRGTGGTATVLGAWALWQTISARVSPL